ncbi:MAG TPA: peptidoglycan-binding domain-containing protein [Acidobacteriota bacterium]|nr:peptidoglycan-binding domain-containing protein [Acidobacteriota bacterium]
MSTRIDSGRTGAVPRTDIQETTHPEKAEQTSTSNNTAVTESGKQALASNATERAAENQMTGQILASQLQAQTPATAAAPKVPSQGKLIVEGSVDTPPKETSVKDFQKEINEFRTKNGQTPIKEDGIFGPETKAAVKQFQKDSGLKDDGMVGDNTRSRLRLENSPSFQGLNPDTKDQIRGMMNGFQKDPTNRQLLTTIGMDESFAKLSRSEQEAALKDLSGSASSLTHKTLQGMSNDELLKVAEQPGGQERLEGMKFALQQGPITAETIKQLDRLNSATFKEGPGLKINGTPENKAAYLHLVRQEMLTSPSFAKTMNELNNDKTHRPVIANVGRDMPKVRLDIDRNGTQDIDLNDFDKLPRTPDASNPHAITQGEVLSHAMREARERVKGSDHDEAHKQAIIAENEYRKDIGQTSTRKVPPPDGVDETRVNNELGDTDLVIHFDGAPDETLKFDNQQRLVR